MPEIFPHSKDRPIHPVQLKKTGVPDGVIFAIKSEIPLA